jgi:L-iditol 2-dehydrogenase
MTETMLAVVCHAPHDYRVEEVPKPRAGPREVIIQVEAAGICASDMKCFAGGLLFWGENMSGGYVSAPCIAGHEFGGRVVALGEGAAEKHGVRVGDRAVAEQIIPCWNCRFCKRGQYWMCQVHNIFGFKKDVAEGGMAQYVRFPAASIVHRVPESLTDEEIAYIEPLACAIHAVQRGEIALGDCVVIAGVGNIGLCMLQVARLHSPGLLIAVDTLDYRLDLARKLGADVVINAREEDAVARVRGLTDGYGCDVYVEATGQAAGVQQGLAMIRRLGTFVEFSVHGNLVTADWTAIGDQKELNIHGSHLGPYCYPLALDYVARGQIDVRDLVSARYPLREFDAAMEAARSGRNLKTLLIP